LTLAFTKIKPLAGEFLRYLIVGGTAFLVDYGVLFLCQTFIFEARGVTGAYILSFFIPAINISTALGFIVGLVINYILSLVFVFKSAKEQNRGKTVGAFVIFAVIGVIGLLLTEGGMILGVNVLKIHYLIVKIFVTGFVLIWNYVARKILIFK